MRVPASLAFVAASFAYWHGWLVLVGWFAWPSAKKMITLSASGRPCVVSRIWAAFSGSPWLVCCALPPDGG